MILLWPAPEVTRLNWRGAWNSGTAYSVDDLVGDGGESYRATVGIAAGGAAPASNSSWDLVADDGVDGQLYSVEFRGDWEPGTYALHDLVVHEAALYMATGSTAQEPPGSGWVLVQPGFTGDPGATGAQGPAGQVRWRGRWVVGRDYSTADAVQHAGSAWMATSDTSQEPPRAPQTASETWTLLAPGGPAAASATGASVWRGTWRAALTYAKGDVVVRSGILYVAKTASQGATPLPTSATRWTPVMAGMKIVVGGTEVWSRGLRFRRAKLRREGTEAVVKIPPPSADEVDDLVAKVTPFTRLELPEGVSGRVDGAIDIGGHVRIRGNVTPSATAQQKVATVLDAMKPQYASASLVVQHNGQILAAEVNTDGEIRLPGTAGQPVSLDNVTYPAFGAAGIEEFTLPGRMIASGGMDGVAGFDERRTVLYDPVAVPASTISLGPTRETPGDVSIGGGGLLSIRGDAIAYLSSRPWPFAFSSFAANEMTVPVVVVMGIDGTEICAHYTRPHYTSEGSAGYEQVRALSLTADGSRVIVHMSGVSSETAEEGEANLVSESDSGGTWFKSLPVTPGTFHGGLERLIHFFPYTAFQTLLMNEQMHTAAGNRIFFLSSDEDVTTIRYLTDTAGSEPVTVGERYGSFSVCPVTGRLLYLAPEGIVVVPSNLNLANAEIVMPMPPPDEVAVTDAKWSPDGDWIYYSQYIGVSTEFPEFQLRALRVSTGTSFSLLPNQTPDFSLLPESWG